MAIDPLPEHMQGEKIGIMGGTFDPIHLGHMLIAESAREEAGLDRVLFIPTGVSYLKEGRDIAERMDRLEMTRLAVADHPQFFASSIEVDRPGKTYTKDTLKELEVLYPGNEWYLIVGADSLLMMGDWVQPEEIFSRAHILCAARGDADIDTLRDRCALYRERFGADCSVLTIGRFDVSSSEIRDRIRQHRSVRYLLQDDVFRYITEHGLYQETTAG